MEDNRFETGSRIGMDDIYQGKLPKLPTSKLGVSVVFALCTITVVFTICMTMVALDSNRLKHRASIECVK